MNKRRNFKSLKDLYSYLGPVGYENFVIRVEMVADDFTSWVLTFFRGNDSKPVVIFVCGTNLDEINNCVDASKTIINDLLGD